MRIKCTSGYPCTNTPGVRKYLFSNSARVRTAYVRPTKKKKKTVRLYRQWKSAVLWM